MKVNLWDTLSENPLVHQFDHHTEFVVGLDFNVFIEGRMATCCKFWGFSALILL
jgi:peroxin-7